MKADLCIVYSAEIKYYLVSWDKGLCLLIAITILISIEYNHIESYINDNFLDIVSKLKVVVDNLYASSAICFLSF